MITKTYIPGKPRNKKLTNVTSGAASVGKTEFNQVAGSSHEHPNKGILDRITEDTLNATLRDILTSIDDSIEPSDDNLMSSLRVLAEILKNNEDLKEVFLSKVEPDTAKEAITFLKGIIANGTSHFANLIASGKITTADFEAETAEVTDTLMAKDIISDTLKTQILQAIVRAELEDVILKGQFNSEAFASGFLGTGFRLNKIGSDWVLELDKVIVRKAMEVYELIIQRVRYQGGQVIHSPAGGKITSVTDAGAHWRIEHDSPDSFTTGAQVFCQTVKVGSEAQNPEGLPVIDGVSVKRYWRLVTSFGKGWFNLSKTDMEPGSAEPEIGDEIAVLGHRTDKTQQAAIMLVSVGADSPYTAYYSGINSYSLEGRGPVRVGNLEGIVDPDFGPLDGHGLYARNTYLKGIFRVLSGKNIEEIIEDAKTRVGGVNLLREYDGRFDLKYWGEDGEIIDVGKVRPKTVLVLSDRYDVLVDEIDGKTTAFKVIL